MKHRDVLSEIATFAPVDGDWRPLDDVLGRLREAGITDECLPVLLGVFERFPEEDGAGVLWGIVHGIESLGFGYEPILRESLSRRSSLMGRIMLSRLERANAG